MQVSIIKYAKYITTFNKNLRILLLFVDKKIDIKHANPQVTIRKMIDNSSSKIKSRREY